MKWRHIYLVGNVRTEKRVTTTKYTQNTKVKLKREQRTRRKT